ncbi:MAG: SRPBCC family protein [Myxococcales bacterium]|nr:SRPBCC family protein [Myxococcales bacterium]
MEQVEMSIDVDVTPTQFYQLITDFERYPGFVPQQTGAKVVTRSGETWRVAFELTVARKLHYHLDLKGDPGRSLDWELVEGDMMTANRGGWTLEPLNDGNATRATYRMSVELRGFVPRSVTKNLVTLTLPATLKAFKAEAERRA